MNYNEEYMYLRFDKALENKSKFLIMYLGLILIYFFNPYIAVNISTLIETALIFAITFIVTTVFKFSNKKLFKIMSILLLLLSLFKFGTLAYLVIGCCVDSMLEYVKLRSVAASLILESIYALLLIINVKKIRFMRKRKIFLLSFFACVSLVSNDIYIFWISSIILISIILYEVKNFELIKSKSINHLKVLLLVNLIIIILDLITFTLDIVWILLYTDILKISAYILIYIGLTEILIRKPYDFLNKKMMEKNNKIRILNSNMEESNRELKKFTKEIRCKETYFKELLENVPTAMIILNKFNLRVFATNKEFLKEIRVDHKRKIINRNIFDFINIDSKEKFLLTKNGVAYLVLNGEEIFWEIEILAETINNLIISLKNITEFKKSEKIRDNLNKTTLEEQIKNDFLSSISHDLKTPINVIYTSSQLQKKMLENFDFEKIDYYNQVNKENCITLMRLANNLIDSSKLDYDYLKPNLKVYNIVPLIEETIDKLSEYIKDKNLGYVFDTNEEEIYVKCDQEFIQRIVINLISNSTKHTKHGGIGVNIKAKKNKVSIEFSDTGEGMEANFVENACLRYYKSNKNVSSVKNKSTGIGLYIVKNLVELQNGKMHIDSIKYVGTNIKIEFNRENTSEL